MGCKFTKSKKNAYARVVQYHKESAAAERSFAVSPETLEWATPPEGSMTPFCLHNLLTDGFYAPFAANPRYLLLIDCRSEKAYLERRLMTSYWHKDLYGAPKPETCLSIVLYDDGPRTSPPSPLDTDPLSLLYHQLKKLKLDPKVVVGGWSAIQIICPHLTVIGEERIPRHISLPWYPSLIIPGFLYLGQAEMAVDATMLHQLRVSHVVMLSDIVPQRVLPSTNYLVVPLAEDDPADEIGLPKQGPDLVSAMPIILAFVDEAKALGGNVLVQCDQGLTRAAVIVMALLMTERMCSLEDAFYYVRGARSVVHPHPRLLQQLLTYETLLFGAAVTDIDGLF